MTDTDSTRWVDLAGADNLRDLGGLPVATGGQVRRGRVYRSGTLQQLTDGDVRHLVDDLGIRTVVDLRLADEAEREGSALAAVDGVHTHSLPLWATDRTREDVVADASMDVVSHYLSFLEGSATTIVTSLRLFSTGANLPAVFHCAAGKDRTGVLAAVLLDALGVAPEAIAADYALTEERIAQIRSRLRDLPTYQKMRAVARGDAFMTAAPDTMLQFLEALHARHGGASAWLMAQGLERSELDDLREALVDQRA